ncbi:MAG: protein kinase [Phycisphaerae bacterium]|nr:protein kinase [Phycisphaerae bacterium]
MDKCLTVNDFERHARGELEPAAGERFERHLSVCERCRTAYQSFLDDNEFLAGVKNALEPSDPALTQTSTPHREADDERILDEVSFLTDAQTTSPMTPREHFPQIEGYVIKRILGRGGMGIVYEAIQEKLNRPVALKLLPAVLSTGNPDLVTRFRREAAAAARLHHTNIIPIYDFGESRDGYYYAMELINGQPLNVVIKRLATFPSPPDYANSLAALVAREDSTRDGAELFEPATDEPSSGGGSSGSSGTKGRAHYRQVARWIADAAQALHYAHLQGLVHRDIKPGNLMLCTDGRLMIMDFGLVKSVGDRSVTATGSLIGTYRYMSPEQVGAKRIKVDARSDVYSLGATLYELLAFQPAFPSTEQSELLSQILFKDPVAPRKVVPTVPVDLQTICLKAMEKAPSGRYQSAKEMADDLDFYLRDLSIVARPDGPWRRLVKLVRRRRMETVALIAVFLLALVTVFGFYSHRKERAAVRQKLLSEGVSAYWDRHDVAAAERIFRQLLERDPNDYKALVNLASVYHQQYDKLGDDALHEDAEKLLDRAVAADPAKREAWNAKGAVYMLWNRLAEARVAYEEVLKRDETFYAAWVNLGMLHAMEGDLTEAERCAQRAIKLPQGADAVMPWVVLSAIQLQLGRDDVLETLTTAQNVSQQRYDKPSVPTLVLTALYHLAQDSQDSGRRALELAVTANTLIDSHSEVQQDSARPSPILGRVKRTLALARLRGEQWAEAIQAAQAALEAGDEVACGELILAVAHGHLGDLDSARIHLQAAEAAWPAELRESDYRAVAAGRCLWFDTAAEYETLRAQARQLIGSTAPRP